MAEILLSAAQLALSAGTQLATSGTVVFSNSNGVSFGMSNSSVITASVMPGAGLAAISAGTTQATSGTVVFSNANGLSFGMNGQTMTASIAAELSSINISAGTTSNNLSAVTFSNANNVSFGLNGSTITASASISPSFAQTVTAFSQDADFVTNFVAGQNVLSMQKVSLPMNVLATQLALMADFRGSSASSGAITVGHAVYTLGGGTAHLASSASRVFSWTSGNATTASSQFGGASGTRYRTLGVSYAMTPGDYLFAWSISTSGGATCAVFGRAAMNIVGGFDGIETSYFLNGSSVSTVGGFPAAISASDTGYARTGVSAMLQPGVILVGTH